MLRSRRREATDLETARQVVSDAEREALDRAEQLRREAEEVLDAARVSSAGPGQPGEGEADITRAREEAVAILAGATREAENLLNSAMAAIEHDTAIAKTHREKAEWDARAAAAARTEAEAVLARARAEAHAIVEGARSDAGRILRDARDKGRAQAHAELEQARQRFAEETAGLRAVMDQARSTLERVLQVEDAPTDNTPA